MCALSCDSGNQDCCLFWFHTVSQQGPTRTVVVAGEETYAACLFLSRRFCCFNSFNRFSSDGSHCMMILSIVSTFRSSGISKRAFFFLTPSGRSRGGLWSNSGLSCSGLGKRSAGSDEEEVDIQPLSDWGDVAEGANGWGSDVVVVVVGIGIPCGAGRSRWWL